MKNSVYILFLLLFVSVTHASASDRIAEADSAYNAKDYKGAIALFRAAAEEHGTSASLLYNLGNAYFQDGDYGHAMLCWQRAKRLDPSDKEVNANIDYLRNRVEDANKAEQKGKRLKVGSDEPSFFQSLHSVIAVEHSSDGWAVLAAVMFILFVSACALYVFSRNVIVRKIGFFGGICFVSLSSVFLIFSFMGAKEMNAGDKGVILAFKVALLTEPGKEASSEKSSVLTKGTIVQILSEELDAEGNVTWYKVRLNSDYIGWVAASDMEAV